MNITETSGTWKVTDGMIENRKSNEIRSVSGIPSAHELACMNEKTFIKKCAEAFNTGIWPIHS